MRKRSSYRPKTILMDPVGYVVENIRPVRSHENYLFNSLVKNHGALTRLTQGKAEVEDINDLMYMVNLVEALYRLGFGKQFADVSKAGSAALHAVGNRGAETGKFILKAEEMNALNLVMELYEAQMEFVTVKDVYRADRLVEEMLRKKQTKTIKRKKI